MEDHRLFEYHKDDFKNMLLDVYNLPKNVDCVGYFDLFKRFREFKVEIEQLPRDGVIRYILLCYDPKSPLVEGINDIPTRKFNALYHAGIYSDPKTLKFDPRVNQMCQGLIPAVNDMIFRFASLVKNTDYMFYIGLQEGYSKLLKDGLSDTKTLKEAESLRDKVELYRQKLLAGDSSLALQDDFFDYILEESIGIKPEEIARKLSKGEDPIPLHINPYQLSDRKQKWRTFIPD